MNVPAKCKELGIEKIIFGPMLREKMARNSAYVLNAIAVHDDLLAALTEAVDFIWDEMRENPDKEDMDGSIMDRLIELQTALISARRKATGT